MTHLCLKGNYAKHDNHLYQDDAQDDAMSNIIKILTLKV